METDYNGKETMIITANVKRNWFNSFAQNCYELEDGTIIYIDYDNKKLSVKLPKKGTLNNIIKFNNESGN